MRLEDLPTKVQEQVKRKLQANNKYNAIKAECDGIVFDSKKEKGRYEFLKMLARAGKIKDLKLQPRYLLQDSFRYRGKKERKIEYVADFEYIDENGNKIVEDVKGEKTQVYKLKRKLFLFKYGGHIEFREV